MCGITGIIMKDFTSVDSKRLKEMNDSIQHRGPDGEGFYYFDNVGFGHRRLAILDLSDAGAQPMSWNNKYTITFNGEIYNYLEIKKELEKIGFTFSSGTDTEIILAAYHQWGTQCVNRFNGMWAFAIHDRMQSQVFISRDRFGVKPLYLFSNETMFSFASEIRQLLFLLKDVYADTQIIFDYLYLNQQNHTNNTFFREIKRVPQGCNLIYKLPSNHYTIEKYYQLKLNPDIHKLSVMDAIDLYRENLIKSINLRLRSDVLVGTCLSGGLDSSIISVIASARYHHTSNQKFRAITAGSIEKETDETHFAELVVKHSNLDWYTTRPSVEEIDSVIEEVIRIQEEPFLSLSIVMQYFVMKLAKESGCIVLLDGQGGDETLLGYERYYSTYLNELPLTKAIAEYFKISKNSKLSISEVLAYKTYFTNTIIRKKVLINRNRFIKKPYRHYFNDLLLESITHSFQSIEALQLNEIQSLQLPKLLNYEDKNSMRFSIEARVPFLDYNLVEIAVSLPMEAKIRDGWTKYPLRMIGKDLLPPEVTWRKNKFGFEAPKQTWNKLAGTTITKSLESASFINELIDVKEAAKINNPDTLWKLYNLSRWAEIYNVKL